MAINNFRHALAINPRSAVLKCYLGMAYLKQGDDEAALRALQDAIATDRLNPLARYEYASALIQQERYTDAIAELEKLKVRAVLCGRVQTTALAVQMRAASAIPLWLL